MDNPLMIETIVEKILSYLPDYAVRESRCICKLWQREADRVLKARHSVTVTSTKEIQKVLEQLQKDPEYRISELIIENLEIENTEFSLLNKLMSNKKTNLSTFILRETQLSQQMYQDLIRLLSDNLTKLEIWKLKSNINGLNLKIFPVREDPLDPSSQDIYWFSKMEDMKPTSNMLVFPKVKNLNYNSFDEQICKTASLLSSAARMFPNLVKLTLFSMPMEKTLNFNQIRLPHLRILKIYQMPNDLTLLSSPPFPTKYTGLIKNNVKCLLELQLNLRELVLSNINFDLSPELLKTFLESQTELQILNLYQSSHSRRTDFDAHFCFLPGPCPFPMSMNSVIGVRIMKPFIFNLNQFFESFPNLAAVNFEFHADSNWKGILPLGNVKPPPSLHALTIWWIDLTSFKKLSSSLISEQITQLGLEMCDDALLRVVFEKFVNLHTLFVADNEERDTKPRMTDEGFTGLSKLTLEKLDHYWYQKMPFQMCAKKAKQLELLRTFPHIGSLKKLSSIQVTVSPSTSSIKYLLLWGFWNLPKLHTLNFKHFMDVGNEVKALLDALGFYICCEKEMELCMFIKEGSPFFKGNGNQPNLAFPKDGNEKV